MEDSDKGRFALQLCLSVSSSWFPVALKFGQVERAYFSFGRIQILL